MIALPRFTRWWAALLSVGAHPGETDIRRGKRRIVVGYAMFGSLARFIGSAVEFGDRLPGQAVIDISAALMSLAALALLHYKPERFLGIVNGLLFFMLAEVLSQTVIRGGLVPSAMVVLFGLLTVLGALIVLSVRPAFWWFLAFVATVALAVVLPERIGPSQMDDASAADIARTIVSVTIFLFAAMAYFVRQRDRLQTESDDLLHNILPDEIAERLKAEETMIADAYEAASVLFADVVDFTPMSSRMSPPELVGLLNDLFSAFDGFVREIGLEKIKTVGDEYMVAAGVPRERSDHADAIAELALRISDHVASNRFYGHEIKLRIGINSGPVIAGIVGTHKFAYDLWGDTVNVASRMESGGVSGSIQVSAATHELIQDNYLCEPRGLISVKGKGEMETYFLISKRSNHVAAG